MEEVQTGLPDPSWGFVKSEKAMIQQSETASFKNLALQ